MGERGKWMMGIEEGICWDEHWVLYVSNESRESTPKTKSTLYTLSVSQLDNKLYLKKKRIYVQDFIYIPVKFHLLGFVDPEFVCDKT